MDLNGVIAELRSELEAVKQITAALEKLYEIRKRRESEGEQVVLDPEESEVESKFPAKKKKKAPEQASAQG